MKDRGCTKVYACATHAVLSGPAKERIMKSDFEQMVFTDTVPMPEEKKTDKIIQLSIAPIFAEAIRRVHNEISISSMSD